MHKITDDYMRGFMTEWIKELIIARGESMSQEEAAPYAKANEELQKFKEDWEKDWKEFEKLWHVKHD